MLENSKKYSSVNVRVNAPKKVSSFLLPSSEIDHRGIQCLKGKGKKKKNNDKA